MFKNFTLYLFFILVIGFGTQIFSARYADAYVSVHGYFRSNGTYVSPYVRSNPNGLKYDNYGWAPSQGLYNKTYGTRGTYWDTPTYITDPGYYQGKAIYDLNHGSVPTNASINSFDGNWYCNTGYKTTYDSQFNRTGCEKIIVPANASLSTFSNDWYCNTGYKTTFDNSFNKVGCEKIIVPMNASLSTYMNDWYCNRGYKTKFDNSYNKIGCEQVIIPPNASLDYFGSDWVCNSGYKTNYDSNYNKVGCN